MKYSIENADLQVTVLREGGHIAAILDKKTGVNPLWTPPWDSAKTDFGTGSDARLLKGIAGHNLCLDIFGGPSAEEEAAGMTAHGEGSVVDYDVTETQGHLIMKAMMPLAQIRFERRIKLEGTTVRIHEEVESLASFDRPIGWTQHVTLGPPFLKRGQTHFNVSATKSKVFETEFGADAYLKPGAEFDWPLAPGKDGTYKDLRIMNSAPTSSGYTAHAMDAQNEHSYFTAWSPETKLAFGYIWKRVDFPWLGIWEENHSRTASPWNGKTLTRGMEFGASPFPETRRETVDRCRLFGIPTYRWLPARAKLQTEYGAILRRTEEPLQSINW